MDPESPHTPRGGDRRIAALWVVALALVLILLNAVKPLHMDDPFIYRVAEQIRADPFDPYGFDIFWLQLRADSGCVRRTLYRHGHQRCSRATL